MTGERPPGKTNLMTACEQGRTLEAKIILQKKPQSISSRDKHGKTALHYAAESGALACAQLLVAGADRALLDGPDLEGFTPLHLSVISGHRSIERLLLRAGADPDAVDKERHSAVHWAAVCGDIESLELLLSHGASPSTPDILGAYPIHYAAQMCGAHSLNGKDPKTGLDTLRKLVQRGADIQCRDRDGREPLLWAASAGSSEAVLVLFTAGANVTATDKDGLTALHCAASRGHTGCVETLIALCGARVDTGDHIGCSPLFYAAAQGQADCAQILLKHCADPNRQDDKGRTPAHCAAVKGRLEILRILDSNGADLWIRNSRGNLPLHEAVVSGRKDLVQWLLQQCSRAVNATNMSGRTPLHIAAQRSNVEMCEVLIDYGAFVNPLMVNAKGFLMTPLDASVYQGNQRCAKYLQLHGAVPATKVLENNEINRNLLFSLGNYAYHHKDRSDEEPTSAAMFDHPKDVHTPNVRDTQTRTIRGGQQPPLPPHSQVPPESELTNVMSEDVTDASVHIHLTRDDLWSLWESLMQELTSEMSGSEISQGSELRQRSNRRTSEVKQLKPILTNVYLRKESSRSQVIAGESILDRTAQEDGIPTRSVSEDTKLRYPKRTTDDLKISLPKVVEAERSRPTDEGRRTTSSKISGMDIETQKHEIAKNDPINENVVSDSVGSDTEHIDAMTDMKTIRLRKRRSDARSWTKEPEESETSSGQRQEQKEVNPYLKRYFQRQSRAAEMRKYMETQNHLNNDDDDVFHGDYYPPTANTTKRVPEKYETTMSYDNLQKIEYQHQNARQLHTEHDSTANRHKDRRHHLSRENLPDETSSITTRSHRKRSKSPSHEASEKKDSHRTGHRRHSKEHKHKSCDCMKNVDDDEKVSKRSLHSEGCRFKKRHGMESPRKTSRKKRGTSPTHDLNRKSSNKLLEVPIQQNTATATASDERSDDFSYQERLKLRHHHHHHHHHQHHLHRRETLEEGMNFPEDEHRLERRKHKRHYHRRKSRSRERRYSFSNASERKHLSDGEYQQEDKYIYSGNNIRRSKSEMSGLPWYDSRDVLTQTPVPEVVENESSESMDDNDEHKENNEKRNHGEYSVDTNLKESEEVTPEPQLETTRHSSKLETETKQSQDPKINQSSETKESYKDVKSKTKPSTNESSPESSERKSKSRDTRNNKLKSEREKKASKVTRNIKKSSPRRESKKPGKPPLRAAQSFSETLSQKTKDIPLKQKSQSARIDKNLPEIRVFSAEGKETNFLVRGELSEVTEASEFSNSLPDIDEDTSVRLGEIKESANVTNEPEKRNGETTYSSERIKTKSGNAPVDLLQNSKDHKYLQAVKEKEYNKEEKLRPAIAAKDGVKEAKYSEADLNNNSNIREDLENTLGRQEKQISDVPQKVIISETVDESIAFLDEDSDSGDDDEPDEILYRDESIDNETDYIRFKNNEVEDTGIKQISNENEEVGTLYSVDSDQMLHPKEINEVDLNAIEDDHHEDEDESEGGATDKNNKIKKPMQENTIISNSLKKDRLHVNSSRKGNIDSSLNTDSNQEDKTKKSGRSSDKPDKSKSDQSRTDHGVSDESGLKQTKAIKQSYKQSKAINENDSRVVNEIPKLGLNSNSVNDVSKLLKKDKLGINANDNVLGEKTLKIETIRSEFEKGKVNSENSKSFSEYSNRRNKDNVEITANENSSDEKTLEKETIRHEFEETETNSAFDIKSEFQLVKEAAKPLVRDIIQRAESEIQKFSNDILEDIETNVSNVGKDSLVNNKQKETKSTNFSDNVEFKVIDVTPNGEDQSAREMREDHFSDPESTSEAETKFNTDSEEVQPEPDLDVHLLSEEAESLLLDNDSIAIRQPESSSKNIISKKDEKDKIESKQDYNTEGTTMNFNQDVTEKSKTNEIAAKIIEDNADKLKEFTDISDLQNTESEEFPVKIIDSSNINTNELNMIEKSGRSSKLEPSYTGETNNKSTSVSDTNIKILPTAEVQTDFEDIGIFEGLVRYEREVNNLVGFNRSISVQTSDYDSAVAPLLKNVQKIEKENAININDRKNISIQTESSVPELGTGVDQTDEIKQAIRMANLNDISGKSKSLAPQNIDLKVQDGNSKLSNNLDMSKRSPERHNPSAVFYKANSDMNKESPRSVSEKQNVSAMFYTTHPVKENQQYQYQTKSNSKNNIDSKSNIDSNSNTKSNININSNSKSCIDSNINSKSNINSNTNINSKSSINSNSNSKSNINSNININSKNSTDRRNSINNKNNINSKSSPDLHIVPDTKDYLKIKQTEGRQKINRSTVRDRSLESERAVAIANSAFHRLNSKGELTVFNSSIITGSHNIPVMSTASMENKPTCQRRGEYSNLEKPGFLWVHFGSGSSPISTLKRKPSLTSQKIKRESILIRNKSTSISKTVHQRKTASKVPSTFCTSKRKVERNNTFVRSSMRMKPENKVRKDVKKSPTRKSNAELNDALHVSSKVLTDKYSRRVSYKNDVSLQDDSPSKFKSRIPHYSENEIRKIESIRESAVIREDNKKILAKKRFPIDNQSKGVTEQSPRRAIPRLCRENSLIKASAEESVAQIKHERNAKKNDERNRDWTEKYNDRSKSYTETGSKVTNDYKISHDDLGDDSLEEAKRDFIQFELAHAGANGEANIIPSTPSINERSLEENKKISLKKNDKGSPKPKKKSKDSPKKNAKDSPNVDISPSKYANDSPNADGSPRKYAKDSPNDDGSPREYTKDSPNADGSPRKYVNDSPNADGSSRKYAKDNSKMNTKDSPIITAKVSPSNNAKKDSPKINAKVSPRKNIKDSPKKNARDRSEKNSRSRSKRNDKQSPKRTKKESPGKTSSQDHEGRYDQLDSRENDSINIRQNGDPNESHPRLSETAKSSSLDEGDVRLVIERKADPDFSIKISMTDRNKKREKLKETYTTDFSSTQCESDQSGVKDSGYISTTESIHRHKRSITIDLGHTTAKINAGLKNSTSSKQDGKEFPKYSEPARISFPEVNERENVSNLEGRNGNQNSLSNSQKVLPSKLPVLSAHRQRSNSMIVMNYHRTPRRNSGSNGIQEDGETYKDSENLDSSPKSFEGKRSMSRQIGQEGSEEKSFRKSSSRRGSGIPIYRTQSDSSLQHAGKPSPRLSSQSLSTPLIPAKIDSRIPISSRKMDSIIEQSLSPTEFHSNANKNYSRTPDNLKLPSILLSRPEENNSIERHPKEDHFPVISSLSSRRTSPAPSGLFSPDYGSLKLPILRSPVRCKCKIEPHQFWDGRRTKSAVDCVANLHFLSEEELAQFDHRLLAIGRRSSYSSGRRRHGTPVGYRALRTQTLKRLKSGRKSVESLTFHVDHDKERNSFKLPTDKLKRNKKLQVVFTIGKSGGKDKKVSSVKKKS